MKLNELIEKCGITKAHLAQQIGMNDGTFKNKLSEKHPTMFTGPEMVRICEVLTDISKDINHFIKNP